MLEPANAYLILLGLVWIPMPNQFERAEKELENVYLYQHFSPNESKHQKPLLESVFA